MQEYCIYGVLFDNHVVCRKFIVPESMLVWKPQILPSTFVHCTNFILSGHSVHENAYMLNHEAVDIILVISSTGLISYKDMYLALAMSIWSKMNN
jgi:hypothetical protein